MRVSVRMNGVKRVRLGRFKEKPEVSVRRGRAALGRAKLALRSERMKEEG